MKRIIIIYILLACFSLSHVSGQGQEKKTELLIIGGGASGTMAGIQAARMGIHTLIIEETEWLGGMLTSAGVSAIDGNHKLPSGLWGEFRQRLYNHYGGPEAVATGWVSNTLFEPAVGNKILQEMASGENLDIWYNTTYQKVEKTDEGWRVFLKRGKKKLVIKARLVIDATELGDVMAEAGVPYDIGMDARDDTGESFAPKQANDIIQDMTYVVILKDYGAGSDKTIPKPRGYDPAEFGCACDVSDPAGSGTPENDCFQMMQYGRLPGNKYMINWPKCGNDIYLNIIENSREERERALEEAKLHTLRFVYYLQTELGFKNLGIAKNEFPTKDNLPLIPYHRESRRMKGLVQLTLDHVAAPYVQEDPLYRTGIAVGDYTIDHHHLKNPSAPDIDFVKIRVPSYNVPLGALIPKEVNDLIVAEKSISVSNIVNGATRLQPVVLGIGQAAGALAAVSIRNNMALADVNVRDVQQVLLDHNAYLMPFIDVQPDDRHFEVIQRLGATGILKGIGVPYKWANQTWFYPELPLSEFELFTGLRNFYPQMVNNWAASGELLTIESLTRILKKLNKDLSVETLKNDWEKFGFKKGYNKDLRLTRRMTAVLLDHYLNPFAIEIDIKGHMKNVINQTIN